MENNQEHTSVEIIDILAREGLKKVNSDNFALNSKLNFLGADMERLREVSREATQSPEQDKLMEALSLAKAEMCSGDIERSGYIQNRGSYANLDDIRTFVDPILSKHGLSFRLEPIEVEDKDFLKTVLGHKSGQWYSSMARLKVDLSKGSNALQAYGSALTSMKRYIYGTFFMLHTGGDKD
jgi:hypothetical protein